MEYIIENEYLKVTVTTWGAQVKSVVRKCDGVEHIWQADKSVWGYHGPVLFPYCGKLVDGKLEAKGRIYEGAPHGLSEPWNMTLWTGRMIPSCWSFAAALRHWPSFPMNSGWCPPLRWNMTRCTTA